MTNTGVPQMVAPTSIVMLTCGHFLSFTTVHCPKANEELYCHRCRETRAITALNAEFRVKCRACRYGRRCGAARMTADTYASKHAVTKHHIVDVLLEGKVIFTAGIGAGQTAIPLD